MVSELVLSPVTPGAVYLWGLEVIRAFQSAASPVLTAIVKAVTFLGDPVAYVILIAVIFWCIDERRGALLGIVTLFSAGVTTVIKDNLRILRPFYYDPSVKLIEQSGFSTPSGHAQGSASFWGLFALTMRSKPRRSRSLQSCLKWAVGLGIPFLVGLSRIYLGVHYP
ncbi:MAG: phosphatase PAP2 family protein, partial [Spirochaetaceae bacterium]|nr:phosphatase PAP2 family protein [Spirochaetaceae bacterium]